MTNLKNFLRGFKLNLHILLILTVLKFCLKIFLLLFDLSMIKITLDQSCPDVFNEKAKIFAPTNS